MDRNAEGVVGRGLDGVVAEEERVVFFPRRQQSTSKEKRLGREGVVGILEMRFFARADGVCRGEREGGGCGSAGRWG